MDIVGMLITKEILIAAAAIVAVLTAVKKAFPQIQKNGVWRRLLPFIPLAVGVASAFLGTTEADSPGDKVLVGLWIGFIATHGRKLFKQSVMGKIKE
jgi:hypothetical protein